MIETGFKTTSNIFEPEDNIKKLRQLLILNNAGEITYSQNEALFPVNSVFPFSDDKEVLGIYDQYIWHKEVSNQGWSLVSIFPKGEMNQEKNQWYLQFSLFFCIFAVAVIIIGTFLWRMVYRPLEKFNYEIKSLINSNVKDNTDLIHIPEFDYLLFKTREMKKKIWELYGQIEQKEKRRANLEVEKLLYQINPHFLMNTLDTVHWLAMSIPMVLNLGLSGQPFAGPDIGGFAHHTTPELLARWTQAGVFFPYCRNHSVLESIRQEPWAFGEQIEDICRTYIRLRYHFMPYLYTQFYQAHTTGLPIMRPLIMEYPNDCNVYNLCDQFLVGADVLVAPILRPGTETRSVYLPEGEWIDYWSGERYTGGKYILAYAPLDVLPIYIKAGAMIPELLDDEWKPTLNEQGNISIVLYAGVEGSTSSGQWYEDDARTYAYEQGVYNLLEATAKFNKDSIVLNGSYRAKELPIQREQLQFTVKSLSYKPERITIKTSEQHTIALEESGGSWSYNPEMQELQLQLPNTFNDIELVISAT